MPKFAFRSKFKVDDKFNKAATGPDNLTKMLTLVPPMGSLMCAALLLHCVRE